MPLSRVVASVAKKMAQIPRPQGETLLWSLPYLSFTIGGGAALLFGGGGSPPQDGFDPPHKHKHHG